MQASDAAGVIEDLKSAISCAGFDLNTAIKHENYIDILPDVIDTLEFVRSRSAVLVEALSHFLINHRA